MCYLPDKRQSFPSSSDGSYLCKEFAVVSLAYEIYTPKLNTMKSLCLLLLIACNSLTGCSQNSSGKNVKQEFKTHVGGSCEGCEAIYESPVPFDLLNSVDTLPDFNDPGPKLTAVDHECRIV